MKQIRRSMRGYLEAPIDDKNVMSDSIIENLFDDGNYVWDRNEAMGFVVGYPCYVCYSDNVLRVRQVQRVCLTAEQHAYWSKAIIERVTGSTCKSKINKDCFCRLTFLNNEINKDVPEEQLVTSFVFNYEEIIVEFYWNHKK